MTEKDLKKLNRYQLLELLIQQTERADSLQARLEVAERELQKRDLEISNLGSIAEASLQVTGIFSAAQESADMYLEAARKQADELVDAAEKKAKLILTHALTESRRIKGEG